MISPAKRAINMKRRKRKKRINRKLLTLLLASTITVAGTKAIAQSVNNDTIELLDTVVGGEEIIPEEDTLHPQEYQVVEETPAYSEVSNYYADSIDLDAYKQPVIRATSSVNIRKEPNTECDIIGVLEENETTRFIGCLNGWYEVFYQNQIAYINANYVKLDYDCVFPDEYKKLVYMNTETNIYNSNNYSNPIGTLLTYDSAEVYQETNGFYLVRTNDYVGFVPIEATSGIEDKVVVVDISSQKLTLYYDNKEQLSSYVVTGKPSTPTYIGLYYIYYKEENTRLTGPGYDVGVEYWMPFNGGIGLHDAYWRYGVFGGDIYTYDGSHGCVNMPLDAASEVYNSVDVGTPVLVHE